MNDDAPQNRDREGLFDEVCDEFEALWDAGQTPVIDHFFRERVTTATREAPLDLLTELVMIDMERRWQAAGEATEFYVRRASQEPRGQRLPLQPLIEDYVACLPELGQTDEIPLEVVGVEFRSRQRWGSKPSVSEYCRRFGVRGGEVSDRLYGILSKLTRIFVKFYEQQRLAFECVLKRATEIGRQREEEPPPYCCLESEVGERIVVAPLDEASVSRRHVLLERTSSDELRVSNLSQVRSVYIDSTIRLPPGAIHAAAVPLLLRCGKRVLRIDPR